MRDSLAFFVWRANREYTSFVEGSHESRRQRLFDWFRSRSKRAVGHGSAVPCCAIKDAVLKRGARYAISKNDDTYGKAIDVPIRCCSIYFHIYTAGTCEQVTSIRLLIGLITTVHPCERSEVATALVSPIEHMSTRKEPRWPLSLIN
jgi:hypothetical protein